jgi:hypothetical protein
VKKVVVDTFYYYLASPGECFIIPDTDEKTWMEATDEELEFGSVLSQLFSSRQQVEREERRGAGKICCSDSSSRS